MAGVGGLQAVSSNPLGGSVPVNNKGWWNYVLGYDYNATEPYGGFAKPDLNFNVPAGSQITTLLPGTVTAIDGVSKNGYAGGNGNIPAWGHVVTVKLDQPYTDTSGASAKSTAYLHLTSTNVYVGQHVGGNQSIGYWSGKAPAGTQPADPGFALGNGTNYGADPGDLWGYGFAPGKAPKAFNPAKLIASLTGKPYYDIAQQVQTNSGQCGALDIPCQISNLWTNITSQFVSWGEHIAIFAIALVFIIVGFALLMGGDKVAAAINPVAGAAGAAVKTVSPTVRAERRAGRLERKAARAERPVQAKKRILKAKGRITSAKAKAKALP
jgi:hypothetical protein